MFAVLSGHFVFRVVLVAGTGAGAAVEQSRCLPASRPMRWRCWGGYLLCAFYVSVRSAMEQEWTPLFALILGVGSQVMMLVSPTVGRALCCAAR